MNKRGKVVALVALALVAMGTVSYIAFAQTTNGGSPSKTYLARVAERLGVTTDALLTALYEARVEMIDEAVAAGELTKAQADYLKAVLKARLDYWKAEGQERGFGVCPGPMGFGRGFGRGMRRGIECPHWQAPAATGQ